MVCIQPLVFLLHAFRFMLLYGAVLCRLERRDRAYKILLDGSWVFTFAWTAFFFFEAKIASEEEKFRCGEPPLEALPYYRDRYWIRLRGILGLLGASFLGGGVFFTLGIP